VKFFACTPSRFPLKTICYGAVREADADSPRCERSGALRHGHDKDGDDGGLFALHARRFYADWGTVSHGTRIAAASGNVTFPIGHKTLKAIACKAGLLDSSIAVGNYDYEPPQ